MVHAQQMKWRIVHSEASLGWGGQERRVLNELRGFQERGCPVGLIAPEKSRIFEESGRFDIPRLKLAESRLAFPFSVIRTGLWLRQFGAQVVNTHSSRDGWAVGIAARLARTPLVIRSRHFDVPVPNPRLSRLLYWKLADHVITTSPKVTDKFRDLFQLPSERISTISTGVDIDRFCPDGPKAQISFPAPAATPATPLIGIVGVIRGAKGHGILFEAMRRLQENGLIMRCVVVGDGPARSAFEDQARTAGVNEHVNFLGERNDIPDILRALDVLAIPSLHEAIPQIGLQALACGTAVVASDVGGIPSIIKHGETGRLSIPGDAASLATALREAITNREATRMMSKRGRELVEREHTHEVMLDKLETIYRRYLG